MLDRRGNVTDGSGDIAMATYDIGGPTAGAE